MIPILRIFQLNHIRIIINKDMNLKHNIILIFKLLCNNFTHVIYLFSLKRINWTLINGEKLAMKKKWVE